MKRIIKPNDSDYAVLRKLVKAKGKIMVYNLDNREEDRAYANLHERLHGMNREGLVEYARNMDGPGNFMFAKITYKGILCFARDRRDKIMLIFTFITVVTGLILIFLHFFPVVKVKKNGNKLDNNKDELHCKNDSVPSI